jgi:hypothetical protein
MRSNLVAMLDHVGPNTWLGMPSCVSLWDADDHLVHFTSALRYPVFVNGKNYSGQPSMTLTPTLRRLLDECLAEEAKALSDAFWVPLRPKALQGVDWLVHRGALKAERVLQGLPHPSGANAERVAYFVRRKPREALSSKTDPVSLDCARERIIALILGLTRPV